MPNLQVGPLSPPPFLSKRKLLHVSECRTPLQVGCAMPRCAAGRSAPVAACEKQHCGVGDIATSCLPASAGLLSSSTAMY